MPLYSYKKEKVSRNDTKNLRRQIENGYRYKSKRKPLTLGDVVIGAYNDFHKLMSTSKLAAMFIPFLLVSFGAMIIFQQVWPSVRQLAQQSMFTSTTASLVAGQYIELDQPYSNPGSTYFADLAKEADSQNLLFKDDLSAQYSNNIKLSIPSLNLYDLNISTNVDSAVEEIYDEELKDGLAHFKGTSLPITDLNTYNTVIYGHSSAGDYYQRTKDPAAAFSVLSDIKYGSEIIVEMADGTEYKYKFVKGKVVDANDLSILQGSPGQQQITLFTCYPNGNNGKRFVATGRLIE